MTETSPAGAGARPQLSSTPVLVAAVKYGAILAAGIAVIGAILGGIFAGGGGVAGALIGTAMAVVFLAVTAGSILAANRFSGTDGFMGVFFAIVLGAWLVKFVIFIVLIIVLKDQSWLNPTVMFLSIIAGVLGSLSVDVVVVMKSRLPYVSDVRTPVDRAHSEPGHNDGL